MIEIYVDGSCRGNPGKGGWGAIVIQNDKIKKIAGKQVQKTTNNRMEMTAIIWALRNYGHFKEYVPVIYSDSAYAVNTFNNWMWTWARNDWCKKDGKKVENLDLISIYENLISLGFKAELRKIAGHSGIKYNELADKVATGKIVDYEKYLQ